MSIWAQKEGLHLHPIKICLWKKYYKHEGTEKNRKNNIIFYLQPYIIETCSQFHQRFCARVFRTNVISAAFLVTCTVEKAAKMTFVQKILTLNVDEIDTWSQSYKTILVLKSLK